MGLLDRFRFWRAGKRSVRLTLGAVPLPTLMPDAEASLKEIYHTHSRKGYRLHRYWEVLIIKADREEYRMQFFPIATEPDDCLAVAVKGNHVIRFVPLVVDKREMARLQEGMASRKTFELTFGTELGMMSREGLESIGVLDADKAPVM